MWFSLIYLYDLVYIDMYIVYLSKGFSLIYLRDLALHIYGVWFVIFMGFS